MGTKRGGRKGNTRVAADVGAGADAGGPGATKICARCGRTMAWRPAWRHDWAEVRACSAACRRPDPQGDALEAAILSLAARRGRSATLCPSEATRVVFGAPEAWPADASERTRRAARRLAARGLLEVLQGGQVVDAANLRGPIRLREAAPRTPEPERVGRRRRDKGAAGDG